MTLPEDGWASEARKIEIADKADIKERCKCPKLKIVIGVKLECIWVVERINL